MSCCDRVCGWPIGWWKREIPIGSGEGIRSVWWIDPYALDTLASATAGFYQGWMHRIYLAWDRQSASQSAVQRHLLLSKTNYPWIAWRLLERLRHNVPVLMALGGGLPQNARLLYTVREFVRRLPLRHWPQPKLAVTRRLMDILMRPVGGLWPFERGEIPAACGEALRELFGELGLPRESHPALLAEFTAEWRQEIPYRERLFRSLLNRLVHKGHPLMLVGISHRDREPFVRLSAPWGCFCQDGMVPQVWRGTEREPAAFGDVAVFARQFSRSFFDS